MRVVNMQKYAHALCVGVAFFCFAMTLNKEGKKDNTYIEEG